ncbi:hypothetical protein AGMMS50262_15140 [Bacteroidia bacterium]|nr:hypothetical protein AGMMS50262_15140 [Bacteroidia bacterium]
MYIELSKKQQRIARTLIKTGLKRECENFVKKISTFTQSANYQSGDPQETYWALYEKVKTFDKHIARRYDGMKNSMLYITILSLFYEKVLLLEDIAVFGEDVQKALIKTAKELEND